LVATAVLFIIRHIRERNFKNIFLARDPRTGFLALAAAAALSAVFAGRPAFAMHGSYEFLTMYLLFVVTATDFRDERSIKALILTVIVSTAAGSSWGLMQYSDGTTRFLELNSVGYTNHTAIYLGLTLIAAFYYFFNHFQESTEFEKSLVMVGTLIILAALLLSSARDTLLGAGRVLFVFFVVFFMRDRKKILAFSLLLLLFAVVATIMFHNSFSTWGINQRFALWDLSWKIFKEHPLLGIGAKNFEFVNPSDYGVIVNKYLKNLSHPHNLYLSILSQLGALGFLALMSLLYFVAKSAFEARKPLRPLIISASLAIFTIGFVNTTLHSEHGLLFSLLIAMASGKEPMEGGLAADTRLPGLARQP
jgi:O-antigen ligase